MSDNFLKKQRMYRKTGLLLAICIFFSACSDTHNNDTTNQSDELITASDALPLSQEELVSSHNITPEMTAFIDLVEEHFLQLSQATKTLNASLINFVKKPSKEKLEITINDLDTSHAIFVGGYFLRNCCDIATKTLEETNHPADSIALEIRLDQQPLIAGYLDAVEGYPYSGLIYSDIPITKEAMVQEFQLGDPAYITLGFHALELILKGSDLKRTENDFSSLVSTDDTSLAPAELRRTLYAVLLISEISKDIASLKESWNNVFKRQLIQVNKEQSKNSIEMIQAMTDSEFQKIIDLQSSLDKNPSSQEHINSNILNIKKGYLEKLARLKQK